MKRIAVFASGSGSNAENLVTYFKEHPEVRIALVISNRKNAFVLERMAKHQVPAFYLPKDDFTNGSLEQLLSEYHIDWIVLAGFLMLVPPAIINAFPGRIINIHPALLPDFGGKGMYGMHVHEAVVKSGVSKTGISIHHVNERFDEGEVIAQFETEVVRGDTPESVAAKIHELEMKYFPRVVEKAVCGNK